MKDRVIKFRAWDKQENKMFKVAPRINAMTISITLDGDIIGHPNIGEMTTRFELMQFTGLTDKNGTEIYEGDIVKFWGGNGLIIYFDLYTSFQIEYNGSELFVLDSNVSIIGNIFENPELLNQ